MKKEKKKWETPKLICLYRGRPEEAVLGWCKYTGWGGSGPGRPSCEIQKPKCSAQSAS